MTTIKKEKHLQGAKSIKVDATDGFLPFKSMEMAFNKLTLLIGLNASGKSVLLKLNWALTTIVNNCIISDVHKIAFDSKAMAQFTLDNTFTNQDITGELFMDFECGSTIEIKLDKGKVVELNCVYDADLKPVSQPIFMSKDTRTFSDIIKYMKFKKAIGINHTLKSFSQEELFKLCDIYRLYDILFMELLFIKIDSGVASKIEPKLGNTKTDLQEILDRFDGMSKIEIDDIKMDYVNSDIKYINKAGEHSLGNLSAGEQSLINMFLNNM